jgi:ribulose-5-phosphate 4-epimerase/fuculose-1-phosphate aldolase
VIHTAIFQARPEVACVIHTHTIAGVAISCLEEGLLPLSQTALRFHANIAYHNFEGIVLNRDEQARLVADLGMHNAMILRNRGLLTAGRSVGEAFSLMYNLEQSCRIQLAAQAGGRRLHLPTRAAMERAARQYADGPDGAAGLEWRALRRLADSLASQSKR